MNAKCFVCHKPGTAYPMVHHRLLKADHGGSLIGPSVFRLRVVGWFHVPANETEVLLCSRKCLIDYLDRTYYDHLHYCNECNYDKDCFICEADDGTCKPEHHACNCSTGPGTQYNRAGWGYYARRLIERLKEKDAATANVDRRQSTGVSEERRD